MVCKKKFSTIQELQELQRRATQCPSDVGLHSEDHSIMIDAKSYIGMYTLDFSQPILVVTEDETFLKEIEGIGQTLA